MPGFSSTSSIRLCSSWPGLFGVTTTYDDDREEYGEAAVGIGQRRYEWLSWSIDTGVDSMDALNVCSREAVAKAFLSPGKRKRSIVICPAERPSMAMRFRSFWTWMASWDIEKVRSTKDMLTGAAEGKRT
ncbi:uncharacterized protein L203_104821 [Cryptococcus depauperatus CBS 7841]|uniref:Uncharacterized protein n=1 Tax=Cryptococcus depauperatus CBS 7841 TaxID=1295531 RepID=A0AAJ8JWA5_9TREE